MTLATITFQNFFRLYRKLSGMTGTALTEEEEFAGIYMLDVVEIPTNKPIARIDNTDVVYKTEAAKFRAIIQQVKACHEKGQPVLVGTISIEKSEVLSKLLKKENIPHNVLNAKYHEQEAQIVAQAGQLGAVTIATNMAGRGTDIMLGGNAEFLAMSELRRQELPEELLAEANAYSETEDPQILAVRQQYKDLLAKYKAEIAGEAQQVKDAGGLFIIGTERHESRRIDNQLRGRAGRQGDPGESRFYLSMEDDLMRLFSSDRAMRIMDTFRIDENLPIDASILSGAVENAQKSVESRHYRSRKSVLEYDNVMNTQREVIYAQRRKVLDGENLRETMMGMLRQFVESGVTDALSQFGGIVDAESLEAATAVFRGVLLPKNTPAIAGVNSAEELADAIYAQAEALYAQREQLNTPEWTREMERIVMLRTVDEFWMDHIDAMDDLKQGIGLRSYGQHDPVIAYKEEGFAMFEAMIHAIREQTVRYLFVMIFNPRVVLQRKAVATEVSAVGADAGAVKKQPVRRSQSKVGPNEPCPCGSGKKYKKCCMQKDKMAN